MYFAYLIPYLDNKDIFNKRLKFVELYLSYYPNNDSIILLLLISVRYYCSLELFTLNVNPSFPVKPESGVYVKQPSF
jgi:hypothetical protein